MAQQKQKIGKGGNRKIGRMKEKCTRYKNDKRREKNKIRKLTKYLIKSPNDKQTEKRLAELQTIVGK